MRYSYISYEEIISNSEYQQSPWYVKPMFLFFNLGVYNGITTIENWVESASRAVYRPIGTTIRRATGFLESGEEPMRHLIEAIERTSDMLQQRCVGLVDDPAWD